MIRGRGNIALVLALMLGASVFLTGCEEDEYWDEAWYEEDAAEDHGEYIGYAEAAEIGESADSAADFGNGVVNGGRSMTMRSVRKGSGGTRYGSSGKLEGTIAVVTILADDATSEWNLSEDDDFRMYSTIYNDLRIGCGWIEEACAAYGRDVNFVWDWDAHGELIYRASLNRSIGDNYYGAYNDMQDFISSNIDSEGIKSAFGANGIILKKNGQVGVTSTVAKVSTGAIDFVPVAMVTNLAQTIKTLKSNGYWIVGSDGSAKQDYREIDYKCPIALVVGSEGEGISRLVLENCDFISKITMIGHVNSLNASVATAVYLAQIFNNRFPS